MYCRSCDAELADGAIACTKCGKAPMNGSAFCFKCGVASDPEAIVCVKCGAGLGNSLGSGLNLDTTGIKGNRTVIGLVAIFLGWLGIHKFLLGYTQEGIIMLVISLATRVGSFVVLHGVLGLASAAVWIVGIIEGITYLTKTDQQFYDTYVAHKKPWF